MFIYNRDMKIVSYNVNGIRANIKKGLMAWLEVHQPDILCLQEIKLDDTQQVEPLFTALGYHCYWYPAEKKGYSGVGLLTKYAPKEITYGMGQLEYDQEGRVLQARFEHFTLLSCYFPSGSSSEDRQAFKMKFLADFYVFTQQKLQENTSLIICGDVNICHHPIDIHNPISNAKSSGFLPEERAWVTDFLSLGVMDAFRQLHPNEPHQYTWWTYRAGAKAKNLGWRIDYFFVTPDLMQKVSAANHYPEVLMSDHCPISIDLSDLL